MSDKPVTDDAQCACIPDCTPNTKTSNADAQAEASDRDFAEALALIAKLTLSDSEKAEAVRRLLANNGERT